MSALDEWKVGRGQQETNEDPNALIPDFGSATLPQLDYWLARFVYEVQRKDGNPYPPNSLKGIASGIQGTLVKEYHRDINIFKKEDKTFKTFLNAYEKRTKELLEIVVGVSEKKKDPVTEEDKKKLWDTGVLNKTVPKDCHTVFF